jgi:putative sigma-54 modulation protein
MNLKITFKNLDHTPALDERIREKTEKLDKYFSKETIVKWTCYCKEGSQIAEIVFRGPRFEAKASGKSGNLYKSLDKAVNKMEKQLCKHKEKSKNRMHKKDCTPVILDVDEAWDEYDEDYYADVG